MTICFLTDNTIDKAIDAQIAELYKHLNASIKQRLVSEVLKKNPNTLIVVCKEGNLIIGIAMMALYKVISGHKGMIEDVVVHSDHRGKGIGRKLMEALLEAAKNQKLDEVLLFSGHHRKQAISLYKSLGFQLKDSGLYRLMLD
ncbi:MAG: GNAT family N-acetyltransferase [Flavobacteriaceae bacterium]